MEVIIRKVKPKDVDGIYEVFQDMLKSEDSSAKKVGVMQIRQRKPGFKKSAKQELVKEIRQRNSLFLVAESNNKMVGYSRGRIIVNKNPFFKTTTRGYLDALVVLKKYRGMKLASRLYKEIELWFREKKCDQVDLEVFECNPAYELYVRWGFKRFVNKMFKKLK